MDARLHVRAVLQKEKMLVRGKMGIKKETLLVSFLFSNNGSNCNSLVAAGYSFIGLAPPPLLHLLSITKERKNLTRRRRRIFRAF